MELKISGLIYDSYTIAQRNLLHVYNIITNPNPITNGGLIYNFENKTIDLFDGVVWIDGVTKISTSMPNLNTVGTITTGVWNATVITTTYTQAKVVSVSGTTNRITISGTSNDPIINISTNYIGQSSITTVGTIISGTWNGSVVDIIYGGTNSNTLLNNNRVMVSKTGAIVENVIITPNRVLISDSFGLPIHSTTTITELSYINGVTSSIQTQLNSKLNLTGGTLTGPLYLSSSPTTNNEAATKEYVDLVAQGLDFKETARLATTTTLPTNTYNNGINGEGATLTGTTNGSLGSIDGISVVVGDLILVKNEGSLFKNGLYVVTQLGTAGTPYVLTRSTSMNFSNEFSGAVVPVNLEGLINKNTIWLCNPVGSVTVGTTAITFTQLNGATSLSSGYGIIINGNTISIDPSYFGQTTITTVGTIATGTWTGSIISNTYTQAKVVSVTGTTNRITISGTSNDPIVDISVNYIGQSSITTVGTIISGTWNGSIVGILYGGTGASTALGAFNNLSPLTTKGDLLGHTGSNNVRFPIDSNNKILMSDSSTSTGLKWNTYLKNKSGQFNMSSMSGTPLEITITFTTPFTNNNYSLSVISDENVSWSVKTKTNTGFTISANTIAIFSGTAKGYWLAIEHGEE